MAPAASKIYGAGTKIIGEALAQLYLERYGLDYVALRYCAVYGERQHGRAVVGGHIAETCHRIRQGLPPVIDGDGSQVQDYVYVGDVARANLMAMESAVTGESINIVTGRDTSQKRIVELAIAACGSDIQPEYRPFKVLRLPPATRQGLSNQKAKRLLGWEPQVQIEEGVAKVLRCRSIQRQRSGHSLTEFVAMDAARRAMPSRLRPCACGRLRLVSVNIRVCAGELSRQASSMKT